MFSKKTGTNGEAIYQFKQDFLDGIRKKHGDLVRLKVQQALDTNQLEIELFVNSPSGVTKELMELNEKLLDGIKIIVTHVHQ